MMRLTISAGLTTLNKTQKRVEECPGIETKPFFKTVVQILSCLSEGTDLGFYDLLLTDPA